MTSHASNRRLAISERKNSEKQQPGPREPLTRRRDEMDETEIKDARARARSKEVELWVGHGALITSGDSAMKGCSSQVLAKGRLLLVDDFDHEGPTAVLGFGELGTWRVHVMSVTLPTDDKPRITREFVPSLSLVGPPSYTKRPIFFEVCLNPEELVQAGCAP